MPDWFISSPSELTTIVVSTVIIFAVLILFIRLLGLRSLSKMSSFDFGTTIAVGSLFASVIISQDVSILEGATAIGVLFIIQSLIAIMRRRTKWFPNLVDNQPRLLMKNGEIFYEALTETALLKTTCLPNCAKPMC